MTGKATGGVCYNIHFHNLISYIIYVDGRYIYMSNQYLYADTH